MTQPERKKRDQITPPAEDNRGTPKPGFEGEGARSELGDGEPIDEATRRQNAERNRQLERGRR